MRICVDLSCLENPHWTGVERRAIELLKAAKLKRPDWNLLGLVRNKRTRTAIEQALGPSSSIDVLVDPLAIASFIPRPLWRRQRLASWLNQLEPELCLFPVSHVPNGIKPKVLRTIHDLPMAADGEPQSRWEARIRQGILQRALPTIFVSEATRTRCQELAPTLRFESCVVYNGVAERFFAAGQQQDSGSSEPGDRKLPYVLVIGTLRPRRHPEVIVEAARRCHEMGREIEFYWVGNAPDANLLSIFAPQANCHFLGPQSDAALMTWIKNAGAVISPAANEGFAMPCLEAMALGRPVIAADGAAHREILGDWFVAYPADDAEKLTQRVVEITEDSRPEEEPARRAYAGQFTWAAAATKLVDFIEEIC